MVITIHECGENDYCRINVTVGNNDCRMAWTEKYGTEIRVHRRNLFEVMLEIASWVNNEMCEECLFDVEG